VKKKIPVAAIMKRLKELYPDAKCSLDFTTPLDLLVATILSAQCTDKRVNIVTKTLFQKYKTAEDYVAVPAEELEKDIHSCGTYRMKTKAIQAACRTLIRDFGGKIPKTMKEMLTLRGVGRKTASIVLSTIYGIHEGIAVDTHVLRVAPRLGLTKGKTQSKIESDLMKIIPRKDWGLISHLLVYHGRNSCTAHVTCNGNCLFDPNAHQPKLRSKNI
jgi:endonuclease-3